MFERVYTRISCILSVAAAFAGSASLPQGADAAVRDHFYVANRDSNDISIYGLNPDGSLAPGGRQPSAGTGPADVAVRPDNTALYVANSGSGTVTSYSLLDTGGLSPGQTLPAGLNPVDVAVTPDAQKLYVASSQSDSVFAYALGDGAAMSAVGSYPTGVRPVAIATAPNGKWIYVVADDGAISAFSVQDGGSLSPLGSFGAGASPSAIDITPDSRYVIVANSGSASLSTFAIQENGMLVKVGDYQAGQGPSGMTIYPTGTALYVTNGGSNSVSGYRIEPNGSLTALGLPQATELGPRSPALRTDGVMLYVTNEQSNSVNIFAVQGWGGGLSNSLRRQTTGSAPSGSAVPSELGATARITYDAGLSRKGPKPVASAAGTDPLRENWPATDLYATESIDPDGTMYYWDWDLGDGTIHPDGGEHTWHRYEYPGKYTVGLSIRSSPKLGDAPPPALNDYFCAYPGHFTGRTSYCYAPNARTSVDIDVPASANKLLKVTVQANKQRVSRTRRIVARARVGQMTGSCPVSLSAELRKNVGAGATDSGLIGRVQRRVKPSQKFTRIEIPYSRSTFNRLMSMLKKRRSVAGTVKADVTCQGQTAAAKRSFTLLPPKKKRR